MIFKGFEIEPVSYAIRPKMGSRPDGMSCRNPGYRVLVLIHLAALSAGPFSTLDGQGGERPAKFSAACLNPGMHDPRAAASVPLASSRLWGSRGIRWRPPGLPKISGSINAVHGPHLFIPRSVEFRPRKGDSNGRTGKLSRQTGNDWRPECLARNAATGVRIAADHRDRPHEEGGATAMQGMASWIRANRARSRHRH
ncbi:hypothetical protein EC845_0609 [Comamonas sp. BIGb0124]|nr:hypothetical protein EC845_0609 [Comamonas sp. BIGb0124]